MADLIPCPFEVLLDRMFVELESTGTIFDMRQKQFFSNPDELDFSVSFHGKRASTPFGPASGPHTQMAQNLVLAFLGGSRIMELKTVQILDELEIPRPCIDVPNLGFNVEWSQELLVPESLHEYVKGAMLIEILVASGVLGLRPEDCDVVYDISVGYDLKGIKSEKVDSFLRQMLDASELVEQYRALIPDKYARFRDLPFKTQIADSITISTFHGCPPDEVELIAAYLLESVGTHTIIKFNPTQLGPQRLRELLNDKMGFPYHVPDQAFEDDMAMETGLGMCERLLAIAKEKGLGFGAKFTNTLIVQNPSDFLPKSEDVVYLSGRPLHVLAVNLMANYRRRFGNKLQLSFSAGIEQSNFADSVALGLTPITVCTDLLKKGGYARGPKYLKALGKAMKKLGASSIDEYIHAIHAARAGATAESLEEAMVANTDSYAESLEAQPFYHREKLGKPPAQPGTPLKLFDCLTCDICIPVCPNDANFAYDLSNATVAVQSFTLTDGNWVGSESGEVALNKRHQIANFSDLCNECGNCDVYCPDIGGPYQLKPRFYGSLDEWRQATTDGFHLAIDGGWHKVWARFSGQEFQLTVDTEQTSADSALPVGTFESGDLRLSVGPDGIDGKADDGAVVDATYIVLMNLVRKGVLGDAQVNYPKLLAEFHSR